MEEAHLLLVNRLQTAAHPGDVLAIVTGPEDELVYYKRVHKATELVRSNWLVSAWTGLRQRTVNVLCKLSSGVFVPIN